MSWCTRPADLVFAGVLPGENRHRRILLHTAGEPKSADWPEIPQKLDTNLALLIDFENIAAGTEKEGLGRFDVTAITERLADKGRVLIARSYADWGRFSRFKQALLGANVTMYELTSHGMQDKNRADIAMVVDALELAFTKDYIDTFVIVSGDSDFTPLVLKMRELDKRVIGIGTRSSTSRLLVNACDEFIFYDTIVKTKKASAARVRGPRAGARGGRQSAYDLLVDALAGLQREDPKSQLASIVKRAMRRKTPDFSENELGYSSFARFLDAAAEAGYITLSKDEKAGGYRVDAADAPTSSNDDDEPEEDSADEASWTDSYLTPKSQVWVDALEEQGIHPLSYPTRMQVLQVTEAVVKERAQKRRKNNVQFVREDVRKRLRKTIPDIPARLIRAIFTALMNAGLLIHKDGTAIRSASASFMLEKGAETLNRDLLNNYLAGLEEANADLHDVEGLAELFLGDKARKREVEEALAWLTQSNIGTGDESSLNDIDLDDLLVAEPSTRSGSRASKPAPAAEKKAEPKKTEPPKAEVRPKRAEPKLATSIDDLDDLLLSEEDPEPAPKKAEPKKAEPKAAEPKVEAKKDAPKEAAPKAAPKKAAPKKAATKAAPKKAAEPKAEAKKADEKPAAAKPAAKAAEAKPAAEEPGEAKPRTRRRVRRKADEDGSDDTNSIDLDDLLSAD